MPECCDGQASALAVAKQSTRKGEVNSDAHGQSIFLVNPYESHKFADLIIPKFPLRISRTSDFSTDSSLSIYVGLRHLSRIIFIECFQVNFKNQLLRN
ncbi:hypothetical protein P8452_75194 [Trifolium repens]|nr:hypothetical protein P8452_75194 [Trifolium repens]